MPAPDASVFLSHQFAKGAGFGVSYFLAGREAGPHLKAMKSGAAAARSLPMKAFVSFLLSIFKIRTDGDAGAILLREH